MLLRSAPRAVAAVLATCLLALAGLLLGGCADSSGSPGSSGSSGGTTAGTSTAGGSVAAAGPHTPGWTAGHRVVRAAALPVQARGTLALIDVGGPYPYSRDGIVFGNREKDLPARRSGYYHEYTVPTPGARDRGARRIVTGDGGEIFYTDDHYRTFEAVLR